MSLPLDTHVLLWWLLDERARSPIESPDTRVQASVVRLWETSIKVALRKAACPLAQALADAARDYCRAFGFMVLSTQAAGVGMTGVRHP